MHKERGYLYDTRSGIVYYACVSYKHVYKRHWISSTCAIIQLKPRPQDVDLVDHNLTIGRIRICECPARADKEKDVPASEHGADRFHRFAGVVLAQLHKHQEKASEGGYHLTDR